MSVGEELTSEVKQHGFFAAMELFQESSQRLQLRLEEKDDMHVVVHVKEKTLDVPIFAVSSPTLTTSSILTKSGTARRGSGMLLSKWYALSASLLNSARTYDVRAEFYRNLV